jgi:NADPH2:quinone reductase
MRAVIVNETGSIKGTSLAHVPEPVAAAGEVLVKIAATAINYVDLLVIAGKYQFTPDTPFTPGKAPAGVIVALGEGVTEFVIGDRVLAMAEEGAYAEYVSISQVQCYRLPDSLTFTDAAAMALGYDTAWVALRERARLQSGQSVLVLGATGAVGYAAVQVALAMGARVLASVSSIEKRDQALAAGADEVIDLSRDNIRDSLREQVYAVNDDTGVDVVIDPLGDKYQEAALRALNWRGRLVVVGFAAGEIPLIKANYLLLKNIEVSGLQISDYRKRMPELMKECFTDIFSLYDAGKIQPATVKTYTLSEYLNALKDVRDRTTAGRVVLDMTPQSE